MTTTKPRGYTPWPLGGSGLLPPVLAIFGAVLMAIGSVCPWAEVLTTNDMDTDIYPVIRGVMIAASIGYLGVAAAMSVRGPRRALVAAVLGLGSLGAILGCLAFIAIGQVGYYHDRDDGIYPAVCHEHYTDCAEREHTLYDPDIGIGLIVLGSLITGAVALWVLASWARGLIIGRLQPASPTTAHQTGRNHR